MNVVDIVLLVAVALAALYGLRLGAVLLVLSVGGFWGGLYLGALLAPTTGSWVHTSGARSVVALVTLLGTAVVLGTLGKVVGQRAFQRLHGGRLGGVDSGLGVILAVAASLLAAWLVASSLVNSSMAQLDAYIAGSRIIRSLDTVLPPPPPVFSGIRGFLSAEGFPPVFAQLAPSLAGPVTAPAPAQVQAAVVAAGPSTLKIVGSGCGDIQEGSGFVAAPGLVVTNAHVVAGVPHPTVLDQMGVHQTTVVLFDPNFDLAVLRVSGLTEHALALDPVDVPRGTSGAVLGYPGGGPFNAQPAGVRADFSAQGRDIYGQGLTVRDVYELQAIVRPGNSGGPLVKPDGTVIGVVFSRSTTNGDIGYALTSPGVLARVQKASHDTRAVGTGACTNG